MPRVIADRFVDFDFIRKNVHVKPIVPSYGDHMPPEIIYFALDGSARCDGDRALMSADVAFGMTTLFIVSIKHYRSSRDDLRQNECQEVFAAIRALSGYLRRVAASMAAMSLSSETSQKGKCLTTADVFRGKIDK